MATIPPSTLKAVTLTHMRYRRGDPLGHFLFRRELQGLCFALGLLISQALNDLVMTSVQQARPDTCAALETCDSQGWPSSHSQYMFFFAAYFSLLCYEGIGLSLAAGRRSRFWAAAATWPPAVLTMWSRVYLGYHTAAQVFAGAVLGLLLGASWFWIVNNILVEYFPAIEESVIGNFFYIKDSSHIPNVLKFEYDNARAARKKSATD